jgi:hypothetical protein
MAKSQKAEQLAAAQQAGRGASGRTRMLGVLAGGAVLTVMGAEATRVWRLGMLPRSRQIQNEDDRKAKPLEALAIVREGYAVSRTRENSLFTMLASFTVTFGITRWITWTIRTKGGIGPIKDVKVGDRHIHHFLPGGVVALTAGGVAIGTKGDKLEKYLAIPFGAGVALVLDETALLLELDDVYWTEEGVLSVQIMFAAIAMLSALAYLIRMLRTGEEQDTESDWEVAAKAWDDLQGMSSAGGIPGIGL